jgi:hypothetical protein
MVNCCFLRRDVIRLDNCVSSLSLWKDLKVVQRKLLIIKKAGWLGE